MKTMSFRMSLRTSDSEVKQSIKITRLPRRPPNRRAPRNDIQLGIEISFKKLKLIAWIPACAGMTWI